MRMYAWVFWIMLLGALLGCHKHVDGGSGGGGDTTVTIKPQVDPPIAKTIGFFLDDWQAKTFVQPSSYTNTTAPAASGVTVTIDRSNVLTKIPSSIYGNNANIWMSQMVTETSLMESLTNLKPNIIRFPGGSISDVFFWNAQPNVPPADAPAQLLDAAGTSSAAGFCMEKILQAGRSV